MPTEQIVGLGAYGKTLTVLTCLSVQETYREEDGEDGEDLAERLDSAVSQVTNAAAGQERSGSPSHHVCRPPPSRG